MIINGRQIGPGHPPYIVAEISGEHKGDFNQCLGLIMAAKHAGADAAKLQLYNPILLAEARGGLNKQAPPPWDRYTLRELYTRTHTPRDWFPDLFAGAKEIGITLFSSVFDEQVGIDYLERLDCPAYKISSFEITNLALIAKAASTGKPVIISTGMANDKEIVAAVNETVTEEPGKGLCKELCPVALLHCVSSYPCRIENANLYRFVHMRNEHSGVAGLSDHTLGWVAPIVATALGASIIEKHITLSREDGGPDAPFSLEPHEFKQMVADVRDAYASLGTGERPKSEEIYRGLRYRGKGPCR